MGLALLVVAIIWAASRAGKKPPSPPPPRRPGPPPRPPRGRPDTADVVGGWLLGHQIAQGHHGFPGDPLPGDHLGSPQDLAFWGGVFTDEDEDLDSDAD